MLRMVFRVLREFEWKQDLQKRKSQTASTGYAKPAPLRVLEDLGNRLGTDFNHAGGESPAHCLRFANPAEANGRLGRLEAGRLRYEDEDKAGKAKRQILYVLEALWDPFRCPYPSKIDPKSSWNHQKLSSGSRFGSGRVEDALQYRYSKYCYCSFV